MVTVINQQCYDVPDEVILNTYAFVTEAQAATSNKDRTLAIHTNIEALRNHLPPGIFVRYGSSRADIMEFFIIGPEKTPYANGAFEFDLLFDSHFPKSPPKVQYKTTSRGTVRMNPNLYDDGKVCLSLLDTWSSEPCEQWIPNQSTILQLLLSIQSMILNEEPYTNEPVHCEAKGTPESEHYSKHIYPLTVKYAMLDWLTGSIHGHRALTGGDEGSAQGASDGIWHDVLTKHFSFKKDQIIETLYKWISLSEDEVYEPPTTPYDALGEEAKTGESTQEQLTKLAEALECALGYLIPPKRAKRHVAFDD